MPRAATARPSPDDWKRQTFETMVRSDKDVLTALKHAQLDINRMLQILEFDSRSSATVRRAQLMLAKRNIQARMAVLWRQIGDVTQARRLEAANRLIDVQKQLDVFTLARAGYQFADDFGEKFAEAMQLTAESGLDRLQARLQGDSFKPLSQRVYNSSVNLNGQVDRIVNSALASALSAREFAAVIKDFINPATPGGVRYAALRLSRTEINNSAHAIAVHQVQDKPWVEFMRWHLSGSHPRTDICNAYASGGPKNDGLFPKGDVPAKPHPQCLCFVTAELPDEAEFEDALLGGKYDAYLEKYRNLQPGQVISSTRGEIAPPTPLPRPKAPAPKKAVVRNEIAPPPEPSRPVQPIVTKPFKPAGATTPAARVTPELRPSLESRRRFTSVERGSSREFNAEFDATWTNPRYPEPPYTVNCVHVVNAYELRARGFDVTASRLPSALMQQGGRNAQEALDRWTRLDGFRHDRSLSPTFQGSKIHEHISRELADEGARGWVTVHWGKTYGGGAHIFTAERINGRIVYIDAQKGDFDFSIKDYAKRSKGAGRQPAFGFARVDDLKPGEGVVEFI
jgi:hypothetical protein